MRATDELQQLADKCRRVAADIQDDLIAKKLLDLADEYEVLAKNPASAETSRDVGA